jgi:S1-C subfamily serine protease
MVFVPGSGPDAAPTRVCPTCGRRVPKKIAVCRCGASLETTAAQGAAADAVSDSPSGIGGALQTAAAVAASILAVVFGVYWLNRPPAFTPPAPTRTESVAPRPEPETAVAPPPSTPQIEPPAEPPPAPVMSAPAPIVIERRAPDVVPLEDVVSRVMPAVVLVEASGAKGSGFFVASDTLLTNVHVVGSSSTVTIKTMSGGSMSARVAATSLPFDIAVLKVSTAPLGQATIPLGDSLSVRVGQEVFAIGSALGTLQNTVTRGIVSGIRQSGNARLVQTDAAVNPGNSGGPLLDRNGTAIGIATMGYGGLQGLNFAVAIEHARPLIDGRPAPITAAADAAHDLRDLSPMVPSGIEGERAEGLRLYEQVLDELARAAAEFDGEWRKFRQYCYDGRVVGAFDHEWFALFADRALPDPVAQQCSSYQADFQRQASVFRDAMLKADDDARRAGVYPGPRRDARRQRRLESPAWDR